MKSIFIARPGDQRMYVQSALNVATPEKRMQETASLIRIPDSFQKVVVREPIVPRGDEKGIRHVGIRGFLSAGHPDMESI